MSKMTNPERAQQLLTHIGASLLQDRHLSHDTWCGFTVVVNVQQGEYVVNGFHYNITGESHPFPATKVKSETFQELQAAMQLKGGKPWKACLIQVKASDYKAEWEFEYEDGDKYRITKENSKQMAARLRPNFKRDEYWVCPLSHDVILTMTEETPELTEDMDEINLHCMIANSFLRGMKRGITDRSDLATFAVMSFEFSPNFDSHPAIQAAFLKVKGQSGALWGSIYASVPETVWSEVGHETFYDVGAWFSELPKERELKTA